MKHWTDQAAGRVPLTGATGYVAGRLLRKLEESGRPVRCMVAHAAKDRTGCDREPERLIRLARRRRRHSSPRPRTIFRTAASPSVAKTMKLLMSKSVPRSSPSRASQ